VDEQLWLSSVSMRTSTVVGRPLKEQCATRRSPPPVQADFFFVPFYSRLALGLENQSVPPLPPYGSEPTCRLALGLKNQSARAALIATLRRQLEASPYYRRSGGRDHMFLLSSGRPMELLFGEALPLLADAIRLQVVPPSRPPDRGAQSQPLAGLAAGRWQRKVVRVPHFVPWLPQDDAVTAGSKRRSVCLEAMPQRATAISGGCRGDLGVISGGLSPSRRRRARGCARRSSPPPPPSAASPERTFAPPAARVHRHTTDAAARRRAQHGSG